jgi:hypothetical protein
MADISEIAGECVAQNVYVNLGDYFLVPALKITSVNVALL